LDPLYSYASEPQQIVPFPRRNLFLVLSFFPGFPVFLSVSRSASVSKGGLFFFFRSAPGVLYLLLLGVTPSPPQTEPGKYLFPPMFFLMFFRSSSAITVATVRLSLDSSMAPPLSLALRSLPPQDSLVPFLTLGVFSSPKGENAFTILDSGQFWLHCVYPFPR